MLESFALVAVIVLVFVGLPVYLYRRFGWAVFSDAVTQLMSMFR